MLQNKYITIVLQNIAMVGFYLLSLGLVFFGGWYLLNSILLIPASILALYIIIFLLASGLFGAWLWVLIKLPSGLATAFDPIKNKIASREISSAEEFSIAIGEFLVDYFSFFRFDLVAVQIGIKNNEAQIFPMDLAQAKINEADLLSKSKASEDVMYNGTSTINGREYHSYIIPIWFGNEWLGYICAISDTRLNKTKRNFLKSFEEHYLDDQLMHVIYYESMKQNRLLNVNGASS